MSSEAGEGKAVSAVADTQHANSPQRPNNHWQTVSLLLSSIGVGWAVTTAWPTVLGAVQYSAGGSSQVRFGFPLAWITQDQSQYLTESFPQVLRSASSRNGTLTPTTEYDWAAYIGDILLWAVFFWLLQTFVAIPLGRLIWTRHQKNQAARSGA